MLSLPPPGRGFSRQPAARDSGPRLRRALAEGKTREREREKRHTRKCRVYRGIDSPIFPPDRRRASNQRALTCRPALAERETAFAFALPESLPALPPACFGRRKTRLIGAIPARKARQRTARVGRRAVRPSTPADGRRAPRKLADTHHCARRETFARHDRDLRAATDDAVYTRRARQMRLALRARPRRDHVTRRTANRAPS